MDFCLIGVNCKWVTVKNGGLLPRIALFSAQVSLNLIDSGHSCNVLYRLSSPKPAFFPSRFELPVSLGKEFFFLASKFRMRRHVSDRTVEPDRVVVMDVLCYCLTSIINAGHALGLYAVPFDRPMISLNLSIALRVVGRSFHMGHSCDTYEFFEISGDELGAVNGLEATPKLAGDVRRSHLAGSPQDHQRQRPTVHRQRL